MIKVVSSFYEYSELVPVDDPEYRLWAKIHAKNTRSRPLNSIPNPTLQNIDRNITVEYQLWESALRKVLKNHVCDFPRRILKYKNDKGVVCYREIDFIGEIGNSLFFCEIKFRQHCNQTNLRSRVYGRGWEQVRKSYSIAKNRFSLLQPLLIIVDMSYIFDIPYLSDEIKPNYLRFENLKDQFEKLETCISEEYSYKGEAINLLWIDSKELFELTKKIDVLSDEDMTRFRNLFQARIEEGSREITSYSTGEPDKPNNPFSALKNYLET